MERYGNDNVEPAIAKTGIAYSFTKPPTEGMTEMLLSAVLEFMDELPNEASAAIYSDRGFEMQRAIFAIRAIECLRNRAGEWFGALGAKWGSNAGCPALTTRAKIFVGFHRLRTNSAQRRIEKRRERPQSFSGRKIEHISTIGLPTAR